MKRSVKFLLSGGGTGGHIYPAVSIANELKSQFEEAEFLFVGSKDRMEMEKVPQAGYEIKGLWISGLQRKLTLKNLLFPIKLVHSLIKALFILRKFKPNVVIGTGGFASGPTLFMARFLGIKSIIQEQNSYPGITNKLLAKKTNTICVAYDDLERHFPSQKIVKTGNPVRQDLIVRVDNRAGSLKFFDLDSKKKTLVIIGGSLGARAVNNLIEKHIHWLVEKKVQVIWQTGKLYYDEFKKYNDLQGVQTFAFLDRMDLTYAAADVIISRAGASSISELCLVGKPVIFIPSPNVAEDHQTKNALAVVKHDAGLLLKESETEIFERMFEDLINDEELQKKLSKNIRGLGMPNATKDIVKEVVKLIKT